MKITIESDADAGKWWAEVDGQRYDLSNCTVNFKREPERDHDAEEAARDGFVHMKPGSEVKLLIEASYYVAPLPADAGKSSGKDDAASLAREAAASLAGQRHYAAIETANYLDCGFIIAAADLALGNEAFAAMVGGRMGPRRD